MVDCTEEQKNFLSYAASAYAGIDGGDENAEYWFVGMEWSERKDYFESYADWQAGKVPPYKQEIDISKGAWNFENRLDNIYQALPRKVSGKKIFAKESNAFKLNLFPLSFKTVKQKAKWNQDITAQKTGFVSFAEYQKGIIPARKSLFAELLKKGKQPKTVFCFGIGYREYFAAAFGLQNEDFELQTPYKFWVAYPADLHIGQIILCPFYFAYYEIEPIIKCMQAAENRR